MKVLAARLRRYCIRLRVPLETSSGSIHKREGIIVELKGEGGLVGRGEAAPAAWVGGESCEQVQRSLQALLDGCLDGQALLAAGARLEAPSARAALETALLELAAKKRRISLACLLAEVAQEAFKPSVIEAGGHLVALQSGATGDLARRLEQAAARVVSDDNEPELHLIGLIGLPERLPLAALCCGETPKQLAQEARQIAEAGFATFKLKVAAGKPEEDLARLRALREGAGRDARLRIDGNRGWNLEQALAVLTAPGVAQGASQIE